MHTRKRLLLLGIWCLLAILAGGYIWRQWPSVYDLQMRLVGQDIWNTTARTNLDRGECIVLERLATFAVRQEAPILEFRCARRMVLHHPQWSGVVSATVLVTAGAVFGSFAVLSLLYGVAAGVPIWWWRSDRGNWLLVAIMLGAMLGLGLAAEAFRRLMELAGWPWPMIVAEYLQSDDRVLVGALAGLVIAGVTWSKLLRPTPSPPAARDD
jgi:hypothetical protein